MTTARNIENAYLELIIGPMFSGKTSKIIEIYKQCLFCNIKVSVINHSMDTRYHDNLLSSHDKIMVPCIQANCLSELWLAEKENNLLIDSDVILINEGQFFTDLHEIVIEMLKCNKKVYICGLDGDFERNPFGKILNLIPYCDHVIKLTSLCSLCKNGNRGIFSMRISNEKQQTLVGVNNYVPVCRNCYANNANNANK